MPITTGITNGDRLDAAGRSATEKRNVATARAVMEGFARGDFTVLPTKLAPGAEVTVVGLTPEKIGPKRAADPGWIAKVMANGLRFDILDAAAERDFVAIEWKDEAETTTGKHYENDGVSLFRFDAEGRVTSYREYLDLDRFLAVI